MQAIDPIIKAQIVTMTEFEDIVKEYIVVKYY